MSDFYAKICRNGHLLIQSSPVEPNEYCEVCGAGVLSKCPACNVTIKEWNYNGIVVLNKPRYTKPLYCKSCGKPYPWTAAAIEATAMAIQEDSELSELERKNLEDSLPDLISETPKTGLASIRVKKALLKAGSFTADGIRQFVIDFGCELAKKSIGL